jgi:hypothetical protein
LGQSNPNADIAAEATRSAEAIGKAGHRVQDLQRRCPTLIFCDRDDSFGLRRPNSFFAKGDTMRHLFLAAILLPLSAPLHAEPFGNGDPKIGETLVKEHCTSCHVSRFGGDGSEIYTRPNHRIMSSQQLATQIGNCNQAIGGILSEQKQMDIAAYLNQAYYKFKE